MRLVQTAIGLLLLSVPVGACTIFDARSDCTNNPWGCAGEMGNRGTTASSSPSCDDGEQNGDELAVDCGGSCAACDVTSCTSDADCSPLTCVDGFCCNTRCDGLCMGCAAALTGGVDGFCAPLELGTSDPEHQECNDKGGCGAKQGHCQCDDGEANGFEKDVDCGGPECSTKCTVGQLCVANEDCGAGSSFCVDGVCCNTDCAADCESCNQPGFLGLCRPLTGDEVTGSCTANNQRCHPEFACEATNAQSCGDDDDCASGLCMGSQCVACDNGSSVCALGKMCLNEVCVSEDLSAGDNCVANKMCASGHCVDGVCCDQKCDGFCMGCHQSYTGESSGLCAPIKGGLDPHNECSGPGAAATCSGAIIDGGAGGASACGENSP